MTELPIPISRPLLISDIPASGRHDHILATQEEKTTLSSLLGLPCISYLEADLASRPFGKHGACVEGTLTADIVQTCVVSSEDFQSRITAPIEIRFAEDGVDANAEIDLQILIEEGMQDLPDLVRDGKIDLGAIVTEFLALALDPYPRKPGVSFSGVTEDETASPFAVLKNLKRSEGS